MMYSSIDQVIIIMHHKATGYAAFTRLIEQLAYRVAGRQPINVFFSGKKYNGISWCRHSQIAEPIVMAALERVQRSMHFVYVDVGGRDEWNDRWNPFRRDMRMQLWQIPTLLRWGQPRRMLDGQRLRMPQWLDVFFNG